jgi:hypothetical protein
VALKPELSGALATGGSFALVGGISYGVGATGAVAGVPPALVAVFVAVGTLLLLPFLVFGAYCGLRWVGLEPAPFLATLWRRGVLPPRAALAPAVALGAALVFVVGSVPLTLALLPPVEAPDAHPFAQLDGPQLLLANLIIVVEEVVFRLAVLFPILALLRVRAPGGDRLANPGARGWLAFALSGALFGLAHAPDALLMGAPFWEYALFALVQKGLFIGTLLGYVTWRWGLETSILAHYATNMLLMLLATLAPTP